MDFQKQIVLHISVHTLISSLFIRVFLLTNTLARDAFNNEEAEKTYTSLAVVYAPLPKKASGAVHLIGIRP